MRILKSVTLIAAVAVAFLALSASSFASPMGTLSISNCSGGALSFNGSSLQFLPVGSVAGTGCINSQAGTNVTSTFGPLSSGATGDITDLTLLFSPGTDFMKFGGLDFKLTGFSTPSAPTSGTNCAAGPGTSCIISASTFPFLLTSTPGGFSIGLKATGTVTDASGTSDWSGAFTSQIAGGTASSFQTDILAAVPETFTYSGTFMVTPQTAPSVPEPASLMLLGSGLSALAFGIRRKLRK